MEEVERAVFSLSLLLLSVQVTALKMAKMVEGVDFIKIECKVSKEVLDRQNKFNKPRALFVQNCYTSAFTCAPC